MIERAKRYLVCMMMLFLTGFLPVKSTTYYIDAAAGDDDHPGTSILQAFRTLDRVQGLNLLPGDSICLASGQVFPGMIQLIDIQGTADQAIVITTCAGGREKARIDASGYAAGILLVNGAHILVEHIEITASGTGEGPDEDLSSDMRCGVLVTTDKDGEYVNIALHDLHIRDVFYHDPGHTRSKGEVKTANGTGRYGWGIRLINRVPGAVLKEVRISDSRVTNVSHTGIKLTSRNAGISDVVISGCEITRTGGPGIQMSGVQHVLAAHNRVDRSGSSDDSRKWGSEVVCGPGVLRMYA